MLIESEAQDILGLLEKVLLGAPNPDNWLKAALNSEPFWRDYLEAVGQTASILERATATVNICIAHDWDSTPTLTERLILGIELAGFPVPDSAVILARIGAGVDPRLDRINSRWVHFNQPFLDREPLRRGIRTLCKSGAPPILVVNGASKAGNSYCNELFQYAFEGQNAPFQIALIEVAEGATFTMDQTKLARLLVEGMDFDLSADDEKAIDPDHRDSYWYSRWILQKAMKTSRRWVFMLDGFSRLPADNSAHSLIRILAADILKNERYRQRVRLVLLHYPDPFGRAQRGKYVHYDLADWAQPKDVQACFEDVYNSIGKKWDPNELSAQVAGSLSGLTPGLWTDLFDRVYDLAEAIRGGKSKSRPAGGGEDK
jgi:hypothetical protein